MVSITLVKVFGGVLLETSNEVDDCLVLTLATTTSAYSRLDAKDCGDYQVGLLLLVSDAGIFVQAEDCRVLVQRQCVDKVPVLLYWADLGDVVGLRV